MIQLYHVYKSYGGDSHALADVTLDIEKGAFVYLTGASGAGKTTLLRLVYCADRPSRGHLLVNGRNLARLRSSAVPYLRRNIGVVFQDFKLLSGRTVEANVAITLEVTGADRRETRRRTCAVLKQVGLAHKLHHLPPRLSGGEQQRVAVARALVNDPQILLADEPTGNLDAESAGAVMDLLTEANARGTTVVIATHDPHIRGRAAGRVIALENGRLAAS